MAGEQRSTVEDRASASMMQQQGGTTPPPTRPAVADASGFAAGDEGTSAANTGGALTAGDGQMLEGSAMGADGPAFNSDLGDAGSRIGTNSDRPDDADTDDEEEVRRRAHGYWEQEGRPEGRHDDHWHRASIEVRQSRR